MNTEKQHKWDNCFMAMAWEIGKLSPDPSTKVGCVIASRDNLILAVGYNGFPRGVEETPERWERPLKYEYVVHAERNAILNAARTGRSLLDARLYVYYNQPPCNGCVLDIIQAGIKEVVLGSVPFRGVGNGTHYDTNGTSPVMLREAGVEIRQVNWTPGRRVDERT